MTLPLSTISMSEVNVELGLPAETNISLDQGSVRTLAGVPTGAISMQNLQGKSAQFAATISSSVANLDLYTFATGAGYPGSGAVQITVAPGVYVYSTSVANAGMTIPNQFAAGQLTVVNNGFIMGRGGFGAPGAGPSPGTPAPAQGGGPAISLATPVTIVNNSFIGGGGGGGGAGSLFAGGGGGAGGGDGGRSLNPAQAVTPGGPGGAIGAVGTSGGGGGSTGLSSGAGGGRIFAGTGGVGGTTVGFTATVATGGGAGGGGGVRIQRLPPLPTGAHGRAGAGGGGGWGATGGTGFSSVSTNTTITGGAGGAAGGGGGAASSPVMAAPIAFSPGSAGGNAITLNGNTATRSGSGTTYGAIS